MNDQVTFTRRRRLGIVFNVVMASLLAPAAAGLVVYLCFRPEIRQRIDLTPSSFFAETGESRGRYSLSERTLKILENLNSTVEIFAAFKPEPFNRNNMLVPGLEAVIANIAQHTSDILREYELHSRGKVALHLYNPNLSAHMARVGELSAMIGKPANNVVYVKGTDRGVLLELQDLADYDDKGGSTQAPRPARLMAYKQEESISSALLSVTEEEPLEVAILTGHGEKRVTSQTSAAGRTGLTRMARGFTTQNFALRMLDLSQDSLEENPPDVVAIFSPTRPIPESEVQQIVSYAQSGGKLFILLDPDSSNSLDAPLLDDVYGLERLPGIVCELTRAGAWVREPSVLNTSTYSRQSPIVEPLLREDLDTIFQTAGALNAIEGRSAGSREPLVYTSPNAWRDLPDASGNFNLRQDPGNAAEAPQPYTLAFSATAAIGGGRAVVVADSDVFDDLTIPGAPGNRPLSLNSMDWLAEREQLISIPPTPYNEIRVDLSPDEYTTVQLYVVWGIPGLALLAAFAVFWNRRQ